MPMNDNPDDADARLSLADLVNAYHRAQMQTPEGKQRLEALARQNRITPGYMNNPLRQPFVQGGIAARSLFGLDPTDHQRLEDAFSQFPAGQYGRMPGR